MDPNRFGNHLSAMMTRHSYPERQGPFPTAPLMQITGPAPGPRLVVTGPRKMLESLAETLWSLPDLAGIRGVLILRVDTQPTDFDRPDDVLKLDGSRAAAFRRTLGRMTALGMIQGRGVPLRWVA